MSIKNGVSYTKADREKAKAQRSRLFTMHASYPGGKGGITYQGAGDDVGQKVWDFILLVLNSEKTTPDPKSAESVQEERDQLHQAIRHLCNRCALVGGKWTIAMSTDEWTAMKKLVQV